MVTILAVTVDTGVTVVLTGGTDVFAGAETQIRPRIALSDSPTTCQDLFGLISHKMLTWGGAQDGGPRGPKSPQGSPEPSERFQMGHGH